MFFNAIYIYLHSSQKLCFKLLQRNFDHFRLRLVKFAVKPVKSELKVNLTSILISYLIGNPYLCTLFFTHDYSIKSIFTLRKTNTF